MEIISKFVTDHKRLVIALFAVPALVCVFLFLGVNVNFNIVEYLPQDAASTRALSVMEDAFTQAMPNARVMLRDVSVQEALVYKRRLGEIEGVSDVTWLDDIVDIRQPLETADRATVESYYKDGSALLSLSVRRGGETAATEAIYALIGETGALTGDAVGRAEMQRLTGSETTRAIAILVPIILIILLLTTRSWLEPLLFLGAIGVSIVINMGTNIIFGEISFITNAVSPILQLAVSLDYAIFLLHSFETYRRETDDIHAAMRMAMKRALPAVGASAATTLFGFLALVFMRFRIGSDLGVNLAKGIVLSFLSVMVFLPALTLCCHKLLDKTKHRPFLPSSRNPGRFLSKLRAPALILVALLLVPVFLAQRRSDFTYGFGGFNENSRNGRDSAAVDETFGRFNPVVLLVPRGDVAREKVLGDACAALPHVTSVVSYAATVGAEIPDAFLDPSVTDRFYSEDYSRLILYVDTPEEGEDAFAAVENIRDTARAHYGDDFHMLGQSVSLYDMKSIITQDNGRVNAIAVAAIFLVLLLTFRSLSLPFLLLLTIEAAVWFNLSVPYFTGTPLCYIGYLVLSTVQLGATVDYAILFSDHYIFHRKRLPKQAALKRTLGETFRSILLSGTILSLAGFTLWFSSSNPIVSDLGLLLGRGALLSMAMVFLFLPALLALFDKFIERTTLRTVFADTDAETLHAETLHAETLHAETLHKE
ncbi:MAG: MMPL family transporter [Oscillospiraceae bacterium]|jgi:predicted RND superfamily exporter protein|nr:MMPL family transporter [Oscillospiraceae bacterium]